MRPELASRRTAQAKERLLNAHLRPQRYEQAIPDGIVAARQLRGSLINWNRPKDLRRTMRRMASDFVPLAAGIYRRCSGAPVVTTHSIAFEGFFEQAPNPDSRISLSNECDMFGQRKVHLNWELTALDRHSYRATSRIFSEEMLRLGLGRVVMEPWLEADLRASPRLSGTAHHLGATRMADNPRFGVVDKNCRVHGIDNLFIAGASVFPTGGWAWPTFTIIALSLRLADHLKTELAH